MLTNASSNIIPLKKVSPPDDECEGYKKPGNIIFNDKARVTDYNMFVPVIPNRIVDFTLNQHRWLLSLTPRERYLLALYTYTGDRVINQILRGNQQDIKQRNCPFEKTIPLFDEYYQKIKNLNGGQATALPVDYTPLSVEQTTSALEKSTLGSLRMFTNELLNLTKKAPVVKELMYAYRGVKREEDIHTHGNEFLSTTFNEKIAKQFQGDAPCCFLYIAIHPGVRVIWMDPVSNFQPPNSENEILICPPFNVTKRKLYKDSYAVSISPIQKYARPSKGGKTRKSKKTIKKTRRK